MGVSKNEQIDFHDQLQATDHTLKNLFHELSASTRQG